TDTIIRTVVLSGLRRGEVFALQWPDIDWGTGQDGGRIHVQRAIYQGVISTPKTRDSARVADVPQPVLAQSQVHRGGRLHVSRAVYQGVISTPKTRDSARVVDVPQSLLDELQVYRAMHPGD